MAILPAAVLVALRPLLVVTALGALVGACGAVFPRYTTATRPVPDRLQETGNITPPPDGVRAVRAESAEIPATRPDGQAWDSDGLPDPYVVVFRNDVEVYRSPVARDTLRPTWEGAPVSLFVSHETAFRFELRDADGLVDDAISVIEYPGVPSGAMASGAWRVSFPNTAALVFRLDRPTPRFGMGVTYEIHEDYLRVLSVEHASPGTTAGLAEGDRITHVDGVAVSTLDERGARQAMDRSALRDVTLRVVTAGAAPRDVTVRPDAVYPARKP